MCFNLFSVTIALQRFAEQPKYTEVNPGHDALLICKIIDKRGTCSWQKDNKPVGIYPKKYEWASSSTTMGLQSSNMGGDCSLWVRSATLDFDNGLWECQVTASDFTTQDALTSAPVKLVVRGKWPARCLENDVLYTCIHNIIYVVYIFTDATAYLYVCTNIVHFFARMHNIENKSVD